MPFAQRLRMGRPQAENGGEDANFVPPARMRRITGTRFHPFG